MISAYTFHAVNLVVAMLLVPLLLHYLSPAEYSLWLIFTAFGGFTIHLQNAIQNTSIKEIARGMHLGEEMVESLQRMRSAYAGLVLIVTFPFLGIGLAYLHFIVEGAYTLEWCLFVMSYAVVYAFAPNYSILLGMDRVATSNKINTVTRLLYFLVAAVLLNYGLSILAICLSFALSTIVSAVLSTAVTRNHTNPPWKWSLSRNVTPYAIFAVSAFALYNGSYLIAVTKFPQDLTASYGLGLQISLLLLTLSLAPLQVWLARLVRAIATGDERKELLRNLVVINLIFGSGAIFLLVFGDDLLLLIASRIPLPKQLVLIFCAFAVELNIAVLVNFLMAKDNYRFVKIYVPVALTGLGLGILAVYLTNNIYGFIIVPLCIQSVVSLPWIARITFAKQSIDQTNLSSSHDRGSYTTTE